MEWLLALIEARKVVQLKKIEYEEETKKRIEYENRQKNKWRLVHSAKEVWTERKLGDKTEFTIHYRLFINGLGDRDLDIVSDIPSKIEDKCYLASPHYIEQYSVWLRGSYVEGIKSYDEAGQDELASRIKRG